MLSLVGDDFTIIKVKIYLTTTNYDILNICADGATTRYGMRHDLAFWVMEVR